MLLVGFFLNVHCHSTQVEAVSLILSTPTSKTEKFCLLFVLKAVRVANAMQEEVTAKRGELDAMQNKLVIRSVILFNILLFLWLVRLKKHNQLYSFSSCFVEFTG